MILLINPPFLEKNSTYYFNYVAEPYPNPAIALLAAVLYGREIDYGAIDAKLNAMSLGEMIAKMKEMAQGRPLEFIGLTNSNTTLLDQDCQTIEVIRRELPGVPIVVGGPHVSALPERTLNECAAIDVIAVHEGKDTILDLHDYYGERLRIQRLEDIPSIAFRDGNTVRCTPLARPDKTRWKDIGPARYADLGPADHFMMFTALGCPFDCSYCYNTTNYNFSVRSIDAIIEELRYVIDVRKVKKIWFVDATFAVNRQHTIELLNRMIFEGISEQLSWNCTTRVNTVDEELLGLMYKSGCREVCFGVESTVDRVLERAHKKTSRDMIFKAFDLTRKAKLKAVAYLVFGHIGETECDILETIDTVAKLNPYKVFVGVMVPWPGTEVYELAVTGKEGFQLLEDDFRKFDKYFGSVLHNARISHKRLESLRARMYLTLYLKNLRLVDLAKFAWAAQGYIGRKLQNLFKRDKIDVKGQALTP